MTETQGVYASPYARYIQQSAPFYRRMHRYLRWGKRSPFLALGYILVDLMTRLDTPTLLLFVGVPCLALLPGKLYRRNERLATAKLHNLAKQVVQCAVGPKVKVQDFNWRECYFRLEDFVIHGDLYELSCSCGDSGFHAHSVTASGSFQAVIRHIANKGHWLKTHYAQEA